ncbi:MAG: hypothetical protein M5R36_16740 [Deltaproteobacteria bacterium]|nr:hypothetical protein [Deltaproteobacteria bacterium]
MKNRRTWWWVATLVFAACAGVMFGTFACYPGCSPSDDDDCFDPWSGDGDCGGGWDDDFWDDDDDTEPDDDQTDDDTTGPGHAPALSNAFWDPASFTWSANCASTVCTTILFSVCDPDGDLTDPGGAWFYPAGTLDAFFATQPISWNDLNPDAEDVADCETPFETGLGVLFGPGAFTEGTGDYDVAIDLEATDASGNTSNKLENILVTITYTG